MLSVLILSVLSYVATGGQVYIFARFLITFILVPICLMRICCISPLSCKHVLNPSQIIKRLIIWDGVTVIRLLHMHLKKTSQLNQ